MRKWLSKRKQAELKADKAEAKNIRSSKGANKKAVIFNIRNLVIFVGVLITWSIGWTLDYFLDLIPCWYIMVGWMGGLTMGFILSELND